MVLPSTVDSGQLIIWVKIVRHRQNLCLSPPVWIQLSLSLNGTQWAVCVCVCVCYPINDFKNISYLTIPSFDFLYYMSRVLIKSNYFRSQDAFW